MNCCERKHGKERLERIRSIRFERLGPIRILFTILERLDIRKQYFLVNLKFCLAIRGGTYIVPITS